MFLITTILRISIATHRHTLFQTVDDYQSMREIYSNLDIIDKIEDM